MSNEYCVGLIGQRNGCIIENPISYGETTYELLIQIDPKRLLLDVNNSPEFILKPIDNDTCLGLFFKPRLGEKSSRDSSKYRIVEQFFDVPKVPDSESDAQLNDSSDDESGNLPPSTLDVYSMLHDTHKTELKTNHQEARLPTFFLPILRPYQSNALRWMLKRERVTSYQEFVPVKCHMIPDKIFYFNDRTIELLDHEPRSKVPTGGILADEMGLGKTVEILALILSNQNWKRQLSDDNRVNVSDSVESKFRCFCSNTKSVGRVIECLKCLHWQHEKCVAKYSPRPILNYICSDCWKFDEPVRSSATFIVCPSSIKQQWKQEIRKHISSPDLKIFDYDGIVQGGWISPTDLAKYDVVLCDYTVFDSEIYYANTGSGNHSTRPRRKITLTTPLTKINWWRVVLDEAQMVETPKRRCSKMVKMLPATHRWAVTGTPIEKSIDDLYGLMVFLDYEPYTDRHEWNKLTDAFKKGNARPLIDKCLKKIMWRTSKIDVSTEVGIPQQQEIVHRVKMNELEARFYFSQHSKYKSEFHQAVSALTLASYELKMNARTLKLIMEPLRNLRRDCTVKKITEKGVGFVVRKILKTHGELHKHMVQDKEKECTKDLEIIASICNVLAEWHLNNNDRNAALEMYKHVFALVKECSDTVSIDSMTVLKALRNLLEVTKLSNENLVVMKKDCSKEIERIEWKHLEESNASLEEKRKKQLDVERQITVAGGCDQWWSDFFNVTDKEELIVNGINQQHWPNVTPKVKSIEDIRNILHVWLRKIEIERKNVENVFKEHDFFSTNMQPPILLSDKTLSQIDDHDGADHSGNYFKNSNHDTACLFCHKQKAAEVLGKYRCLIYDKKQKRSCYQEEILKAIFGFMPNEPHYGMLTQNAIKYFEVIGLLQDELQAYENYLRSVSEVIKIYAKLRMRPTKESREITDEKVEKLTFNKETADDRFSKNFQILKYVKNLNKTNDEPECPICLELPESAECVLECGHKMCVTCFLEVKKLHPTKYKCHSCRNIQATDNTYLYDLSPDLHLTTVDVDVGLSSAVTATVDGDTIAGDYSKKIQEIVRTALDLWKSDPDVKILIFSHWYDILGVIAAALSLNGIKNHRNIDDFKNKALKVTCLLMPLARGSKGLNLVEATHVFLVEPILNPAEEFQAIGRIHRIGQTKPTFVHRFIVLNTIEETIFTTISKDMEGKWKTTNVTVDSLKDLFILNRRIN